MSSLYAFGYIFRRLDVGNADKIGRQVNGAGRAMLGCRASYLFEFDNKYEENTGKLLT